jgi:hypothetical protein
VKEGKRERGRDKDGEREVVLKQLLFYVIL